MLFLIQGVVFTQTKRLRVDQHHGEGKELMRNRLLNHILNEKVLTCFDCGSSHLVN